MSRPKGSKNKPKVAEIRLVDPVSDETAVALYNAEHPEQHTEVIEMKVSEFREKFPQIPEGELKNMAATVLNGPVFDQGKIQKRINELTNHESLAFKETPYDTQKMDVTIVDEFKVHDKTTHLSKLKRTTGYLMVNDPIQASALARAPFCASAKDEIPFPEDWDKMGKIAKLEWLTAHPRK